jgi:hypothetical protein
LSIELKCKDSAAQAILVFEMRCAAVGCYRPAFACVFLNQPELLDGEVPEKERLKFLLRGGVGVVEVIGARRRT